MVADTPNPESNLQPERYPQHDLFICDVADAVLKDVMPQMEHPFYSLTKKPETAIRRYEHNGQWITITPSVKGLATIYDKDILIYCISQIMAKIRRGESVPRTVRISGRELLMFTNRGTAGKDYKALIDSLDRLEGTRIRTNIITGDVEDSTGFGLIDTSNIKRAHGGDGRLISCELTLSAWLYNAICANEVLTLHRDYFRLRKPIERRIYELARKHCGAQPEIEIRVDTLHKKSGSKGDLKEFRRAVRILAEGNHLPDYQVHFDDVTDRVRFTNRGIPPKIDAAPWQGRMSPDVMHQAREHAPGWDMHYLEGEWRRWLGAKGITPRAPEKNFIKFCQSWFGKRGAPQ